MNRPKPDDIFIQIADYVCDFSINSSQAFDTAYLALLDSMACAMEALSIQHCQNFLGPVVPNTLVKNGSRVPGTMYQLDPIKAAFDIGTTIRWLDFNDTWLAREWGHPSDNLGAILAVSDYVCRNLEIFRKNHASLNLNHTKHSLTVEDVLIAQIKAYEIQGVLALENAFNAVGLDHVLLIKVASTALAAQLLGLNKDQIIATLSEAFADGGALRVYRHAPNTGSRKSWAAGDATSRGVLLAYKVMCGDPGYPTAITAKKWGFSDALFKGQPIIISRPLQSYVMENILFKVSFPAEFHAQTAVEAAITLHHYLKNEKFKKQSESTKSELTNEFIDKLKNSIDKITIETQEAGFRIIHKEGPLHNYADRDHCLQYMVALGLLFGDIKAEHYQDKFANEQNNDAILSLLRSKMQVSENPEFTNAYFDPDKRAIPNAIQIFFKDGSVSEKITVYYPLGHRQRRSDALLPLKNKYDLAIDNYFGQHLGKAKQAENLKSLWTDSIHTQKYSDILDLPVDQFIDKWC